MNLKVSIPVVGASSSTSVYRGIENQHSNSCRVMKSPVFADVPWLVHGFSTRYGGVSIPPYVTSRRGELNLGMVKWDSSVNVAENRRRFLAALPADGFELLTLNQFHSDLLRSIGTTEADSPCKDSLRGDAHMTSRSGLLLSILTADCLPILIADIRHRAIAAVHAGWRGTLKRIAAKTVGRMRFLYDSRPEDLRVAIGPGIRVCCFEVGAEVLHAFESQFAGGQEFFTTPPERQRPFEERHALMYRNVIKYPLLEKPKKYHLDLVRANVDQLVKSGIAAKNIWAKAPCTCCHPRKFFSHRRDALRAGRHMSVIGVC
jgi:polyphenol oxidase